MFRKILLASLLSLGLTLALDTSFAASGDTILVTNCNGTQVVRTGASQMQILHVESNLPGCVGAPATETTDTYTPVNASGTSTETVIAEESTDTVGLEAEMVEVTATGKVFTPKFNPENGPAFDVRSTDITNYRTYQMAKKGIRYTNVTRSVKMRNAPNMQSGVNAYLMDNDAIVMTGSETGWVKSQGAEVLVTDTGSNTVITNTGGKASGYIASKYLRKPTASDLVRISQADQAYWSDIAHVNVAHLVNVREHPWYTAKIKFVLSNQTPLYVISTVDNWSEVLSDDRKIHGFIRSDYITVEKSQRVDK
jgi:hypothetical protein